MIHRTKEASTAATPNFACYLPDRMVFGRGWQHAVAVDAGTKVATFVVVAAFEVGATDIAGTVAIAGIKAAAGIDFEAVANKCIS